MGKILTINAGSSTLKWKLFETPSETVIASGLVDRLRLPDSTFTVKFNGEKTKETYDRLSNRKAAELLLTHLKGMHIVDHLHEITGVGHRVVSGGEIFHESVVINQVVLDEIKKLKEFAPLHNPVEAYYIELFHTLLPKATQVAVFDTAFHTTLPQENFLYSIPYDYYTDYKARKYGAHGTSYRYVSKRTAEIMDQPLEKLKMIICHFGSGVSMAAIAQGKSYDTSMGFTPLDGLPMSTRSGNVDPSLIPYLQKKDRLSMNDLITVLNKKSGFLGVSGVSSDMRDLEEIAEKNDRAEVALDIFANRTIEFIGSYIAELNGLDVLVFTAGIGENAPEFRQAICDRLSYFGIKIDAKANDERGKERLISTPDSKIKVYVVPTNEELEICRDVVNLQNK